MDEMDATRKYRGSNGIRKAPPNKQWLYWRYSRQDVQGRTILFQKKDNDVKERGRGEPRAAGDDTRDDTERHGDTTPQLYDNVKGMYSSDGRAYS